jgi:predicted RNA-binding protein associated with RNAse of E/G family
VQRPGEAHAIWVFWYGAERSFDGWYVNLQEPFRRTPEGYDTQDLELDIWLPRDGGWVLKDDELLDLRVREGRLTEDQARAARREAHGSPPRSTQAAAGGRRLGGVATAGVAATSRH